MPFIDAKISKKITSAEEQELKTVFGSAISLFPGKSETWLMCNISDGEHLWFQGTNDLPAAFVEVKLFGDVNSGYAEKFTAEICDKLYKLLDIPKNRVFVRYTGGNDWGFNGSNF